MKQTIIAANWKMDMCLKDARGYFTSLDENLFRKEDAQLIFLMPALLIGMFHQYLKDTGKVFGGQHIHAQDAGPYTGENSVRVLAELGGSYCLVGHSERRTHFGETSNSIAQKVLLCQNYDVTPILCVGESAEERRFNLTKSVIEHQIVQGLSLALPHRRVVIAYEPIWAIGTGDAASLYDIECIVSIIRRIISDRFDGLIGTEILYGGSVNEANAGAIACLPEVDGLLVGKASLRACSMLSIVLAAMSQRYAAA